MDLSDEKGGDAAANAISQPTQSDNSKTIAKRGQVEQASKSADLRHLVQLADSTGGLLDDSLRQLACETSSVLASTASPFANTRCRACLARLSRPITVFRCDAEELARASRRGTGTEGC